MLQTTGEFVYPSHATILFSCQSASVVPHASIALNMGYEQTDIISLEDHMLLASLFSNSTHQEGIRGHINTDTNDIEYCVPLRFDTIRILDKLPWEGKVPLETPSADEWYITIGDAAQLKNVRLLLMFNYFEANKLVASEIKETHPEIANRRFFSLLPRLRFFAGK